MITLPQPPLPDGAQLDRFDAVLDAERAALVIGDEERIAQVEREKAALLDALVGQNRAASPRLDAALRSRLRELADKNRLNGLLIAERLSDVQRRQQFFARIAGRDLVYGPDGVTRPAVAVHLYPRA